MNLRALHEPFAAADIEWRIQSSGIKGEKIWARCLAYVTNRAIMNRLDDVCGQASWRNEFTKAPEGGVMCGLSIKIDGEWVTKWDGAENTDIEAVKGGLSGAMKRAAVQWGIGRYLYDLPEGYAEITENGQHYAKTKEGKPFKWNPPRLPKWALPNLDESTGEVLEAVEVSKRPASDDARATLQRYVDAVRPFYNNMLPKEKSVATRAKSALADATSTSVVVAKACDEMKELLNKYDPKDPFAAEEREQETELAFK